MKVKRKIIEIDEERCDGCGQCVPSCAEGALKIIDGKAKVVADKFCDGLGACLGECPNDALRVIEREADEFDEEAVEAHLAHSPQIAAKPEKATPRGCPSVGIQQFAPSNLSEEGQRFSGPESIQSGLSHWPVQIRLVPSNAPFLNGADLIVVADCVPVAFPSLHRDFLTGNAVMLGCPKFDEAQEYIEKFAKICKHSGIKSITSLIMEVPCCAALSTVVRKGLEQSGMDIPFEEVVISTRGMILKGGPKAKAHS